MPSLSLKMKFTRHGFRYIKMNKNLTGDLSRIRHLLPRRRKFKGVAPGLTGKAVNYRKEEDEGEHQWVYPNKEHTEIQKMFYFCLHEDCLPRTITTLLARLSTGL